MGMVLTAGTPMASPITGMAIRMITSPTEATTTRATIIGGITTNTMPITGRIMTETIGAMIDIEGIMIRAAIPGIPKGVMIGIAIPDIPKGIITDTATTGANC